MARVAAGLLAALVAAGGCAAWYRARALRAESEAASLGSELESARRALSEARIVLRAEREAAWERAARVAASEREAAEVRDELAVCDLDPGWVVPPGLYERLCGRDPRGAGVPPGPPGGVFRGGVEAGAPAEGAGGVP